MRGGFLYLVAVTDRFNRYVLSWELSSTQIVWRDTKNGRR